MSGDEPDGYIGAAMRDFLTLADLRTPTLSIECEACGRRGRYNVAKLIEQHGGDIKLPDLRHVLANCPRAQSASIHDRCKVRYGEDSRVRPEFFSAAYASRS